MLLMKLLQLLRTDEVPTVSETEIRAGDHIIFDPKKKVFWIERRSYRNTPLMMKLQTRSGSPEIHLPFFWSESDGGTLDDFQAFLGVIGELLNLRYRLIRTNDEEYPGCARYIFERL